jgi:hypothetical protein
MSEFINTKAFMNENDTFIKNKKGNKATKCQITGIIRDRISVNNTDLIKWFKMQSKVNKLVRYDYEWRTVYYPKISQVMSKEAIIALKLQATAKPTLKRI